MPITQPEAEQTQQESVRPSLWFGGTNVQDDANEHHTTVRSGSQAASFKRINLLRVTRQELRFVPVGVSVSVIPILLAIMFVFASILFVNTIGIYVLAIIAFGFGMGFFLWTRPVTHPENHGYLELLFLYFAVTLFLWVRTLDVNVMHNDSLRGIILFVATLGYVQIIFSTQVNKIFRRTFANLQITDIFDALLLILVPIGWYGQWVIVQVNPAEFILDNAIMMLLWYMFVSIVMLPLSLWWLQTRNVGSLWIWIGTELLRAGLLILGHEIIWHTNQHVGVLMACAAPFIILFGDQMNAQIIEIQDSQQISAATLTPAIAMFVIWLFPWIFLVEDMPAPYYEFLWYGAIVCIGTTFARIVVSNTIESRTYERVQELVSTDALTGVQNRRSLTSLLQNFEGRIMMTDMDGFKSINDLYGHDQGDLILIRFTQRLKRALGPDAKIFRLGGDEFAIVTENTERTFEEEAELVVMAGLDTVYSEPTVSVGGLKVTMGMSQAEALRNTDIALQAAKAKGKNQYVILGGELLKERAADLQIHTNISNIGLDRMFLEFQPVYSIGAVRRIVAVEALARWNDPLLGPIPPSDFVPILENQGMGVEFGEVIIRKALAQTRTWIELGTPVMVFINLSERHLRDEQDVDALVETFTRIGRLTEWVGIEVKESFLQNQAIVENLWRVRETGVSIGIDDFGSGSSIFPVLRKLPIDIIKLDRTLLGTLLAQDSSRHILKATLDMAVELDINVIVEGVEDQETFEAVAEMGSTLGQGFFWARPQPAYNIEMPKAPLRLKRRVIAQQKNVPY